MLAKTGQDQHLKFSPQSHILFLKVYFLTRSIVSPQANIHGKNSLSPLQALIFFWSSLFKIWDWKLSPSRKEGADTVTLLHECFSNFFKLYKWYQIAQSVSHSSYNFLPSNQISTIKLFPINVPFLFPLKTSKIFGFLIIFERQKGAMAWIELSYIHAYWESSGWITLHLSIYITIYQKQIQLCYSNSISVFFQLFSYFLLKNKKYGRFEAHAF